MKKSNLKFYYQKVGVGKALDNTLYKVKTEELSLAIKNGLEQLAGQRESKTIQFQMGVGFIEDEKWLLIRKELNFNNTLNPLSSDRDYLSILSYDNNTNKYVPILTLRPLNTKEEDEKSYLEHRRRVIEEQENRAKRIENWPNTEAGTIDRKQFGKILKPLLVVAGDFEKTHVNAWFKHFQKQRECETVLEWAEKYISNGSFKNNGFYLKSSIENSNKRIDDIKEFESKLNLIIIVGEDADIEYMFKTYKNYYKLYNSITLKQWINDELLQEIP